jgi:transaldolase / glucose-6-phosphate isomerase
MTAELTLRVSAADQARLDAVTTRARTESWAKRLMDRDTSLWSSDPEAQRTMAKWLGWLDAPKHFGFEAPALEGFGDGVRDAGFTTAVVMGMGGSSLAPDMLHRTFGTAEGYLDLRILDSTDPAAVAATVDDLDPLQTLWIIASKSGTTTEPLAFEADRWAAVERALEERGSDQRPGEFFVAITDPGKSLESIPHQEDLRERFLNLATVGGRYSALTYVGLVPASLIGLDVDVLLESAGAMVAACTEPDPDENPGLQLGIAIGELARNGRDKLTLLPDDPISTFGAWLEQLIAESTGKHGTGILPVDREPLLDPSAYGQDRAFVRLSLAGSEDGGRSSLADALAALGHPVIQVTIDDPIDLAGEAMRWEIATAFAGVVLGINPFDQPNVEEAKELTRRVLANAGHGPGEPAAGPAAHAADSADSAALDAAGLGVSGLAAKLGAAFRTRHAPEYIAIQAFIAPGEARDEAIAALRRTLSQTGCATTAGYGPRFLHSTGQLHKGGPPTGVFLQLTSAHPEDRAIPGWPYTFGQLIDAQARGDREALASHDRPVVHVDLGADLEAGLETLGRALDQALA